MFLKYQIDLHLQTKMTLELTSLNHFAVIFNLMLSKWLYEGHSPQVHIDNRCSSSH